MAKQAPKEGVFIGKNSRGFYYRIKENQHILAFAGGYNTKQNAKKGLVALYNLLHAERTFPNGPDRPVIWDLTKKVVIKKPDTALLREVPVGGLPAGKYSYHIRYAAKNGPAKKKTTKKK